MPGDRVPQVGEEWRFRFRDAGVVEVRGVLQNGDGRWFVVVEYVATKRMTSTDLESFVKSYSPPHPTAGAASALVVAS